LHFDPSRARRPYVAAALPLRGWSGGHSLNGRSLVVFAGRVACSGPACAPGTTSDAVVAYLSKPGSLVRSIGILDTAGHAALDAATQVRFGRTGAHAFLVALVPTSFTWLRVESRYPGTRPPVYRIPLTGPSVAGGRRVVIVDLGPAGARSISMIDARGNRVRGLL
jgi:hypothetical protein